MLQFFIAAFIAAFILFYFTCAAGLKVGMEKHWWTPELDDLKRQCIDASALRYGRFMGNLAVVS